MMKQENSYFASHLLPQFRTRSRGMKSIFIKNQDIRPISLSGVGRGDEMIKSLYDEDCANITDQDHPLQHNYFFSEVTETVKRFTSDQRGTKSTEVEHSNTT